MRTAPGGQLQHGSSVGGGEGSSKGSHSGALVAPAGQPPVAQLPRQTYPPPPPKEIVTWWVSQYTPWQHLQFRQVSVYGPGGNFPGEEWGNVTGWKMTGGVVLWNVWAPHSQ